MKNIIMIFIITSSCTNFIIDPRGSKEPREVIRDKMECKQLIKDEASKINRLLIGDLMYKKCLENRGHSILN